MKKIPMDKIPIAKIRKIMRIFALTVFGCLGFILVVLTALCLILRFDFAEKYVSDIAKEYVNDALSPYGMSMQIENLELALPFSVHVQGLELNDIEGTFAKIEKVSFSSRFFSLLRYEIVIPDIGLVDAQITRIPKLVFPDRPELIGVKEVKSDNFMLPNMEQVFIELADVLFHPNMPTIRFNNIHANDVLVDSHVIEQLKDLRSNAQQQNTDSVQNDVPVSVTAPILATASAPASLQKRSNSMQNVHISFLTDASLDEALFRIKSSLKIRLTNDVPMMFDASLDVFKSKKIRSRITYSDADGTVFRLAKEILSLAQSQKAYASFYMEGTGSFDAFSMAYDADIFDDMYMSAPSTLGGELGIVPLLATTKMHLFPKIINSIDKGDIKFNASARILDLESPMAQADGAGFVNDADEGLAKAESSKDKAQAKNIQVNYDFLATSMDFTSTALQGILGAEQKSQGQLDLVFSKNQYPYAQSDNIYFESKNIKANTSIFFSRKIDIQAQASILDVSGLGSKTQSISGRADGKISITGDVNKLFLNARFEVPTLRVQMVQEEGAIGNTVKNVAKNATGNNGKNIERSNAKSRSEKNNIKNNENKIAKNQPTKLAQSSQSSGVNTKAIEKNKGVFDENVIELESFVFVLKSQGQALNKQVKEQNIKKAERAEKNKTVKSENINKNKKTQIGVLAKAPILGKNEKGNEGAANGAVNGVVENTYSEKAIAIKEQNAYALQVKKFFQLFLVNERKPLPFLLDVQAKYNNIPVHFSSQLIVSAESLGKNSTQNRDIEINNIAFQGLGAKVQGKIRASWDASDSYLKDFEHLPLLRGNLNGTLEDGKALALAIGQPVEIENASFKWDFSVINFKQNKLAKALPLKTLPKKASSIKNSVAQNSAIKNSFLKNSFAKTYSGSQGMNWQFSAKRLAYDTNVLLNNSMNISVKNMWANPQIRSSVKIENLEFDSTKANNWQLQIAGSLLNLKIQTSMQGDANLLFNGLLGIDRKRKNIFLDMHTLNFAYPKTKTDIKLKQKGQFRLSDEEFSANKIHFVIAPKGEVQLNGILRPEHVALAGWWKDIDLEYLPFGYTGDLFGRFNFQGTSKNPTGSVDVRIKDFKAQGYPPVSLDVNGSIIAGSSIHKLALAISLVDKELAGAKEAEIKIQVPMESEPWLRMAKQLPVEGTIKYDGELATLWQYVPVDGRKLTGSLLVDGKISGQIRKLLVEFKAKVKKARYEDVVTGILLTNINAQLNFDPYKQGKILFSALDTQSGEISIQGDIVLPWFSRGQYKAPVKIAGKVPTQAERRNIEMWEKAIAIVDLSSKIKNLKPLQRNDVELVLTGDLKIKGMINDPSITGFMNIDEGEVRLENVQVASIPKLNIVENTKKKYRKRRKNVGNLDLTVNIPGKFQVFGQGIESEWEGKVNILGKINNPILAGNIAAKRGQMDFLGKDFSLVKGEVYFDGSSPIAPIVNVQLGYNAQDIEAKIGVSGTLQSPKLELTSVPYLPEDEILSRILFFSSAEDLSAYEKVRLGMMLTSLAGFSLNTGVKGIGRNFLGLDVIRIGSEGSGPAGGSGGAKTGASADSNSDEEENISVELGKYLRKNIYLGVEQGLSNQETLGITNIEIDNNLSVGAKAGTEEAEVNFEWKIDY